VKTKKAAKEQKALSLTPPWVRELLTSDGSLPRNLFSKDSKGDVLMTLNDSLDKVTFYFDSSSSKRAEVEDFFKQQIPAAKTLLGIDKFRATKRISNLGVPCKGIIPGVHGNAKSFPPATTIESFCCQTLDVNRIAPEKQKKSKKRTHILKDSQCSFGFAIRELEGGMSLITFDESSSKLLSGSSDVYGFVHLLLNYCLLIAYLLAFALHNVVVVNDSTFFFP